MKKSRLLAILLCLVMLFTVVTACNKDNGTQGTDSTPAASSGAENNTSSSGGNEAGGGAENSADAGGSGDGGGESGGGRDTLSMALSGDTGSLDPVTIVTPIFTAVSCIMEPLWDVTEDNEVIMLLAESVDIVAPDEWIVHLRQGVTFSNGNPFTASDVLFSIQVHAAAGATGGPRVQTIDLDRMKVIDDNTFDLFLWDFHIANWTVLSQLMIYDEESYTPEGAGLNPIGTGPYILTEYVPNSYINLERRDDYWGELPAIKYLNFRNLNETSQVVNALETGMIDVGNVAPADVDFVSRLPGFDINSRYTGNYIIIGFNFGENSFFAHNLEARRAVIHAIDPEAVINLVYEGEGERMHGCTPDLCFDWEPRFSDLDETYAVGYSVDLAKQYAESSGLTGQTISIMTDGTAAQVDTAQIIQNMLSAIGVNAEINNYDPATVWAMLYNPDSVYDMSVGMGIAPNRRVGDQLVNGVRYSPTLTVPDAFENNMHYLEIAPLTLSTADDAKRSDYLFEVLSMYENNVLSYGLCNVLYSIAFSKDIDPASIVFTIGTGGVRVLDLKFK